MPILLRDPDGPYFSPGDERAFMEWARQIPCVKQLEGSKSELRLHVKGRRISDACLRELIALFYRYGVAMGQLAQFDRVVRKPVVVQGSVRVLAQTSLWPVV